MMPADTSKVESIEKKLQPLCDTKRQIDHRDDFSSICVPKQKPVAEIEPSLYNEIRLNEVGLGVSCDKSTSSIDSYCQKSTLDTICFDSEVFGGQYVSKSMKEVERYSVTELKILIRNLSKAVEEISSQLVQLLVENDALQQESDARNVAIEQLLRITVKETENELKPVQMSVILTSENYENV